MSTEAGNSHPEKTCKTSIVIDQPKTTGDGLVDAVEFVLKICAESANTKNEELMHFIECTAEILQDGLLSREVKTKK